MGIHCRDGKEHSRSPRNTAGSATASASTASTALVPSEVIDVDFGGGDIAASSKVAQVPFSSNEQMQIALDQIMANNIQKHANDLFESMHAPILGLVSSITKESIDVVSSKVQNLDAQVKGLSDKV